MLVHWLVGDWSSKYLVNWFIHSLVGNSVGVPKLLNNVLVSGNESKVLHRRRRISRGGFRETRRTPSVRYFSGQRLLLVMTAHHLEGSNSILDTHLTYIPSHTPQTRTHPRKWALKQLNLISLPFSQWNAPSDAFLDKKVMWPQHDPYV